LKQLPAGRVVITADTNAGGGSILHDTAMSTVKLAVGGVGQLALSIDIDESMRLESWAFTARSLTDASFSTRAFASERWSTRRAKGALLTCLPSGSYELQAEHLSNSGPRIWQQWGNARTVATATGLVRVKLTR
jgi:hypothetical protein